MRNICSAYFETNDGVRLHYLEAGTGPALVILPGWTQPAASFKARRFKSEVQQGSIDGMAE